MSEQPRPSNESELVELIRSSDVRAPESLHASVEQMIAERSSRGRRSRATPASGGSRRRERARRGYSLRPRLAAVGAIAAAIVALAVVIGTSGGSSTLSVNDAAALTLRAATGPAPAERASDHTELDASVDGVAFPYWGTHFGWHAAGTRTDEVDGRSVTTVFYESSRGRRVGYAIVAGNAPQVSGGVVSRRDGVPYRLLTVGGVPVVTWERGGRLCVMSGRHVEGATLLRLASWDGHAQSS